MTVATGPSIHAHVSGGYEPVKQAATRGEVDVSRSNRTSLPNGGAASTGPDRECRVRRRLAYAGRRWAAARHERLEALDELTSAVGDAADLSPDVVAALVGIPVTGVYAVRARRTGDEDAR